MRILSASHRRLLAWLVPLLGVIGFFAGYGSGWLISIHVAQTQLRSYAVRLMERSDDAFQEAKRTLGVMSRSQLPYCSHEELDQFGYLLFRSRYLRDMGHLSDGKIDCSAMLGPLHPPFAVPAPSFSEPDGIFVYPNLALFEHDGNPALTLLRGRRYVTLSPNLMASVTEPDHFFTFSTPFSRQSLSPLPPRASSGLPVWAMAENGGGRFGKVLFETHCSKLTVECVTAYSPISKILRSDRRFSIESASAGGFAGISVAFLITLLVERRRGLEGRFRRASRHCSLHVAYQPIVDIQTGRTVGAEALARWQGRAGEDIPPADFLPIAAKLGLNEALTRCVVRTLLEECKEMLIADPAFRISFNISAPELASAWLLPFLQAETSTRGIALRSLAVEVTEGSTADHAELAQVIHELRQHAVSVYLDDFGTGYSSLAYLEFLAVDVIKIDKIFTRAIQTASVTAPILRQIADMAGGLRLEVIVEGVESEEQCTYLKQTGHRLLGQGWYFGRPMPAAVLGQRLLVEAAGLTA